MDKRMEEQMYIFRLTMENNYLFREFFCGFWVC